MSAAPFEQRDVTYFYRRVEGFVPGRGTCHSQIELSADGRWLLLRLASTVRFTVALTGSSARTLIHALRTGCAVHVPVTHEDHGARLLRVGPHTAPEELPIVERRVCRTSGARAMDLAVDLPRQHSLRLIFPPTRLRRLIGELATAYLQLDPADIQSSETQSIIVAGKPAALRRGTFRPTDTEHVRGGQMCTLIVRLSRGSVGVTLSNSRFTAVDPCDVVIAVATAAVRRVA